MQNFTSAPQSQSQTRWYRIVNCHSVTAANQNSTVRSTLLPSQLHTRMVPYDLGRSYQHHGNRRRVSAPTCLKPCHQLVDTVLSTTTCCKIDVRFAVTGGGSGGGGGGNAANGTVQSTNTAESQSSTKWRHATIYCHRDEAIINKHGDCHRIAATK